MTLARLIATAVSGLLGLVVLAVLIVLGLTGTEPGTRWLADQAKESLGGLDYDNARGTLLTQVRLTGLRWRSDTLDVDIGDADIGINLPDLISRHVHVESIRISDAAFVIHPSDTPAGAPFKGLPVSIHIDDGNIEQLTITTGGQSGTIESAALSASLVGTLLTFEARHIAARNNRLAASGSVDLAFDSPAEVAISTLSPTVPGALEFSADVRSSKKHAQITGTVAAPVQADVNASFNLTEPAGTIRLTHAEGELIVDAQGALAPLALTGSLNGAIRDNKFEGRFNVSQPDETQLRASLDVQQADNSLRATLADNELHADASFPDLARLSPGLTGALDATLFLALSTMRVVFDAQGTQVLGNDIDAHYEGNAEKGVAKLAVHADAYTARTEAAVALDSGTVSLQPQVIEVQAGSEAWSLSQPGAINVADGALTAAGLCLTDSSASACITSASISGGTVNAHVDLSDLSRGALMINRASASILFDAGTMAIELLSPGIELGSARMNDVEANMKGTIDSPSFSMTSMLTLPGLAEALATEATGGRDADTYFIDRLTLRNNDVDLTSEIRFDTAGRNLTVDSNGSAWSRPVKANADLNLGGGKLNGRAEARMAGDASVAVTANNGNIDVQLNVDEAATFDKRLEGRMTATAALDADGQWQFALDGKGMAWQRNPFEVLRATASGTSDGRIEGDIEAANPKLGNANIDISGSMSAPEFRINAQSGLVAIVADLGLQSSDAGGSAEVNAATVTIAGQPWQLDQAVSITFGGNQLSLSAHCWRHDPASFCIDATNPSSNAVSLTAQLRRLPLSQFSLPGNGEVSLSGEVGADIRLTATAPFAPENINANARIVAPDVRMQYFDDLVLDWQLALDASLENNRLAGNLLFSSGEDHSIAAGVQVPTMTRPDLLSLNADIDVGSLAVIAAFVPQIANATGGLIGKVRLTTQNGRPEIDVNAKITPGASVVLPAGGIALTDIRATLSGDEHRMELSATATSGEGTATAQGFMLEPLSAERIVEIKVEGEQVTAINLPDIRAVASPDLTLSYQGGGTGALRGRIVVNDGAFTLSEIRAGRRTASNDVRVISRDPTTIVRSVIDVDLDTLIENFSIDLYGLKGNVQGDLNLVQRPGNPRRANGNLRLEDGTFSRFGQSFDVERGRLVFGGPLTNPVVDVVSSRTIEEPTRDVKVSLTLFGRANDIRSRLTSTPPMSEARALSYLVLGRPIGAASDTDEQSIATAALLLGLERATGITERVRKTLGLESLAVTSGDTTTVIAGKQLSKDLFVEYSYDVLGQHSGFLLDYRLSDRLSLQTRTGEGQSMQLIYTF